MTTTAAPACTSVRLLPPSEWEKLRTFDYAQRHGLPDPRFAQIVVAETVEGEIVGIWSLVTAVCFEGLWVHPAYRRRSLVAGKLLRFMRALLAQFGIRHSFAMISHQLPEVRALALKAGFV